jgi:hypothetical protein
MNNWKDIIGRVKAIVNEVRDEQKSIEARLAESNNENMQRELNKTIHDLNACRRWLETSDKAAIEARAQVAKLEKHIVELHDNHAKAEAKHRKALAFEKKNHENTVDLYNALVNDREKATKRGVLDKVTKERDAAIAERDKLELQLERFSKLSVLITEVVSKASAVDKPVSPKAGKKVATVDKSRRPSKTAKGGKA